MMHEWEDERMEPEENEDPLDELTVRWDELTDLFGRTNDWENQSLDTRLILELEDRDVGRVVDLVENAQEPISRERAARCLVDCMKDATPAEYAVLLTCLPEGEYAGHAFIDVDWRVPKNHLVDNLRVVVTGTLVSLAVAWNRPEILRMLLGRGHDVDGTSFYAASALAHLSGGIPGSFGEPQMSMTSFSTVRINGVMQYPGGGPWGELSYSSMTPLALAILLGYEDCARLLLEHGATVGGDPGVSRMMNLAWREKDKRYQTVREVVLSRRHELNCRPVLSELTESSRKQFRAALREYSYTHDEYAHFFEKMSYEVQSCCGNRIVVQHNWKEICGKLMEIGAVCPEVLVDRQAIRLIFCCGDMEDFSLEPLLPFLEGRRVDLTSVPWMIHTVETYRTLLSELSGHCKLVADRFDMILPAASVARLKLFIKYVTLFSGERKTKISALTEAILQCNNAKLVRKSLEQGVIQESTKDLLCWLREHTCSDVCREAVLATCREGMPVLENWCGAEDRNGEEFWWTTAVTLMGESAHCPQQIVPFLTGDLDAVKEQMRNKDRESPFGIMNSYRLDFHSNMRSIGCTRLCAAALGGQDDVIKLLLDEFSVSVDEDGARSIWTDAMNFQTYLIDPVLAAALGEHWHTVKLLLERGARPHWEDPWVKELWEKHRGTNLCEEVRFQLGDWAVTA